MDWWAKFLHFAGLLFREFTRMREGFSHEESTPPRTACGTAHGPLNPVTVRDPPPRVLDVSAGKKSCYFRCPSPSRPGCCARKTRSKVHDQENPLEWYPGKQDERHSRSVGVLTSGPLKPIYTGQSHRGNWSKCKPSPNELQC